MIEYSLTNFRKFDNKGCHLCLSPITFFTGCNSSGKSSVSKSLVFLSQIVVIRSNVESLEPLERLITRKISTLIPYGIEGICIQSDHELEMDKPRGIYIGELIINWRRV